MLFGSCSPGALATVRLISVECAKNKTNGFRVVPITGGQNLGRRTEETVAVDGGASMATFFFGLAADSPSLLRFLVLDWAMVASGDNFALGERAHSRWDEVIAQIFSRFNRQKMGSTI